MRIRKSTAIVLILSIVLMNHYHSTYAAPESSILQPPWMKAAITAENQPAEISENVTTRSLTINSGEAGEAGKAGQYSSAEEAGGLDEQDSPGEPDDNIELNDPGNENNAGEDNSGENNTEPEDEKEETEEEEKTEGEEEKETEETDPNDLTDPETPGEILPSEEEEAETDWGDGTAEHPFIITDEEAFLGIGEDLSAYYLITADIDFKGETLEPIGSEDKPFTGVLNGDGYTISSFVLDQDASYIGLFGYGQGADFSNLNLADVTVSQDSSESYAGVLAGYLDDCRLENISLVDVTVSGGSDTGALTGTAVAGRIRNCSVSGNSFVSGASNTGGLVGSAEDTRVEECQVLDVVVTGEDHTGGLIGELWAGNIRQCYAAAVTEGNSGVGGLLGSAAGTADEAAGIEECYASGRVQGNAETGGLIGRAIYISVSNSFAIASVTAGGEGEEEATEAEEDSAAREDSADNDGGDAGDSEETEDASAEISSAGFIGSAADTVIANCYAAGAVDKGGRGLVTVIRDTTVTDSYYDMAAAGSFVTDEENIGKLTFTMMTAACYGNWDFDDIWTMREGETYPYLLSLPEPFWPVSRSRAMSVGDGSEEAPYLIGSVEQFLMISADLNACYRLTADLDFLGTSLTPMGTQTEPFTGVLDGDGYGIKNYVIDTAGSNTGLFGYALGAKLLNLKIENAEINQKVNQNNFASGSLVGYLEDCTVSNIKITNVKVVGNQETGGLAGHVLNGSLTDCSVEGNILVSGTDTVGGLAGYTLSAGFNRCAVSGGGSVQGKMGVGGLIGSFNGNIVKNSSAAITVTSSGFNASLAGGLIGRISAGTITDSNASGIVNCRSQSGGLIGYSGAARVIRCYASTRITTEQASVGGLIGYSTGNIKDCYAIGTITIKNSGFIQIAGLVGTFFDGPRESIKNCYAAVRITGSTGAKGLMDHQSSILKAVPVNSYYDSNVAGISGTTELSFARSTAAMRQQSTYIGWDFENVWEIDEGNGYPTLRQVEEPLDMAELFSGSGTAEDPYLITNAEQMKAIAYDLSACYRLAADIDLADTEFTLGRTEEAPFRGMLDGDGHTIRHLKKDGQGYYLGLLGHAEEAVFQNLILKDADITQESGYSHIGVLAGRLKDCTVTNIEIIDSTVSGGDYAGTIAALITGGTVTDCLVSGATVVDGTGYVGGLGGQATGVTVTGCRVTGDGKITGTGYTGGLFGLAESIVMNRCYTTVRTEGGDYTGGLAGSLTGTPYNRGKITECYGTGEVLGAKYVGGLFGAAAEAQVSDSFVTGSVASRITDYPFVAGLVGYTTPVSINVNHCYAACKISSAVSYVNGLAYIRDGLTLAGSYFDQIVSDIMQSDAYNNGKFTTLMMQESTYVDWDFNEVWEMEEGVTYPFLRNLPEPVWEEHSVSLPTGAGTKEDPYIIMNAEQFQVVKFSLSAFYELGADIDFQGEALTALGTYTMPFQGELDGKEHVLKNFGLVKETGYSPSLFGYASKAVFKNIGIENAVTKQTPATTHSAVLCGFAEQCTIENIRLLDITITGTQHVGGMVAIASGGSITNCTAAGNINITGTQEVGGLIGRITGTKVSFCTVFGSGQITGSGGSAGGGAGGLAGLVTSGSIRCSQALIDVEDTGYAGGLVGKILGTATQRVVIAESYGAGTIKGSLYVGGLAGYATYADFNNTFAAGHVESDTDVSYVSGLVGLGLNSTIKLSYSYATIGTVGWIQGLASAQAATTVTGSYFDSTLSGITTPAAQARTTEQMLRKETYVGWNFTSIWDYREGAYPLLRNLVNPEFLMPFPLTYSELTGHSVRLEWPVIQEAASYEVAYTDQTEINYVTVGAEIPAVRLEELQPETAYQFRVRAKSDTAAGAWSFVLTLTTPKSYRLNEGFHSTAKGNDSISLTWKPVAGAVSYEVLWGGPVLKTMANTAALTGLTPETPYLISIRAVLADGSRVSGSPITEKLYELKPQTEYAKEFIDKCEGQTWFIDEIENLLNLKGKSVNSLGSRQDFGAIYAIGLADRGLTGKIPAAIGELYQLEYLFLANNNLSGTLPEEMGELKNLIQVDLTNNQITWDSQTTNPIVKNSMINPAPTLNQ